MAPYGESALLLSFRVQKASFGAERARQANAWVRACYQQLKDMPTPGMAALVPAVEHLLVRLRHPGDGPAVVEWLLQQVPTLRHGVQYGRQVVIPVRYGGEAGPDLEEVARLHGLLPAEVIALHCRPVYRVLMIGFLPGFAYLGFVDASIVTPRRHSPRLRVEAGSVGIAGWQTGVYPVASAGGWKIIGRTSVALFDPRRADPFLLHPGDEVRFQPL
ncbi:MAG: 5-oxoprolinase subunit PxpB [Firmicutes bacterium]|nr:5-oxoprolinase subunit PxpB [Bacillota bacterium]